MSQRQQAAYRRASSSSLRGSGGSRQSAATVLKVGGRFGCIGTHPTAGLHLHLLLRGAGICACFRCYWAVFKIYSGSRAATSAARRWDRVAGDNLQYTYVVTTGSLIGKKCFVLRWRTGYKSFQEKLSLFSALKENDRLETWRRSIFLKYHLLQA